MCSDMVGVNMEKQGRAGKISHLIIFDRPFAYAAVFFGKKSRKFPESE